MAQVKIILVLWDILMLCLWEKDGITHHFQHMKMKKYILRRVLISAFTLLAITLILFTLLQLMPGSPFNDEKLSDDQRAVLYEKYGLDQPIVVQFGKYVWNLCRGDFGVSYTISKNTPSPS